MSLKVGINVNASELSAALKNFPAAYSTRVFGAPGKGIPSWTSSMVKMLLQHGVVPWVSFKDWADDKSATAMITAWLDAIPADVTTVMLTWHHEPEGDVSSTFTSNLFRRRWVLLHKIVRGHKNGHKVILVPIHTLYPARFKVGDKYNADWTKWNGLWQQWAPFTSTGEYVGDAMGWDCYLTVKSTHYEPPRDFFRVPVSAAHAIDVPLAIPEWGALTVPNDTTGAGRAQWIIDGHAYLASVGATYVNWWHTTGKGGYNYRLDTLGKEAWLKIIRG